MSSAITRCFGASRVTREGAVACGLLVGGLATGLCSLLASNAGQEVLEEISIVAILSLFCLVLSELRAAGKKAQQRKEKEQQQPPLEEPAARPAAEERQAASAIEIGTLAMKVRTAVEVGDLTGAEAAMECLQARGGTPGLVQKGCWTLCYSQLIHAFARVEDADKAEKWLAKFAEAIPAIRPNVGCVNAVLDAIVSNKGGEKGAAARASALLGHMPAMGVQPNEDSYAAVLEACSREGDIHRAMRCRREMRLAGLQGGKAPSNKQQQQSAAAASPKAGGASPDEQSWRAPDSASLPQDAAKWPSSSVKEDSPEAPDADEANWWGADWGYAEEDISEEAWAGNEQDESAAWYDYGKTKTRWPAWARPKRTPEYREEWWPKWSYEKPAREAVSCKWVPKKQDAVTSDKAQPHTSTGCKWVPKKQAAEE